MLYVQKMKFNLFVTKKFKNTAKPKETRHKKGIT